jgi:predicted phage terminase large subunit-like protein
MTGPELSPQRLLDAVLRTDFLAFAQRVFRELNPGRTFHPAWYHEAIVDHLMIAASGQFQRVIINLPPRAGKSTIVSVALPAWLLGRDPARRIIVVTYSQDLSVFFSRQTRQVMQSDWYKRLFPSTRLPARPSEVELTTTLGGFRKATSTGGPLTGRGGDLIIIDDPLKADDAYSETARESLREWAEQTLFTRLDDKTRGAIVLTQQRQHEDDLSGHMLRTNEWLALSLPAIADKVEDIVLSRSPLRQYHRAAGELLDPQREPMHVLNSLKREMGSDAFAAQYQQAPVPPDGGAIKASWFRIYDEIPAGGERIFSVDTAAKAGLRNDWSVIMSWRVIDSRFYLEHIWRERLEYPALKAKLIDAANQLRPDTILIEDKGTGIGLIQELKADQRGFPVVAYDPGGNDKESRMRIQSAKIQGGLVFLPMHAVWLEDFLAEIRRFPNATHDDQIDALSQLLDFKSTRHTGDLLIIR